MKGLPGQSGGHKRHSCRHEVCVNLKLVHRLDNTAQFMRQDLAQGFVYLSRTMRQRQQLFGGAWWCAAPQPLDLSSLDEIEPPAGDNLSCAGPRVGVYSRDHLSG